MILAESTRQRQKAPTNRPQKHSKCTPPLGRTTSADAAPERKTPAQYQNCRKSTRRKKVGEIAVITLTAAICGYVLDRHAGHIVPSLALGWALVGLLSATGGLVLHALFDSWACVVLYTLMVCAIGHWIGLNEYRRRQSKAFQDARRELIRRRDR